MVTNLIRKSQHLRSMVPNIVFVLGGPGAGKGTQCENIVKEYGFVHLSAGDLLRAERNNPSSEYGELIETYIREGKIVPVDITCSLIERAMNSCDKDTFLIDGFPRNQDNLDGWKRRMSDKVHVLFVLFLDCPLEVCTDRCLQRGAQGSGRSDDNVESLKKRFNTYKMETTPIIDYYKSLNLVKRVDATNNRVDVFNDIKNIFYSFNVKSQ